MGRVTVLLTGDEVRLVKAFDRVIAKERKLAQQAMKTGKAHEQGARRADRATAGLAKTSTKAGKANKEAFGAKSLKQLGAYAKGVLGISAAFAAVLSVINEVNAARDELARKQRDSELGMTSLVQLGGGSKKKVRALTGQARKLFAEGGAKDEDEAARVIFGLESSGGNTKANRQILSQLYGIVGDTAGFAKSATTLQTAFGKKKTGGLRKVFSKAFAASKEAPSKAPELLEAAASSAAFAKQLGLSDKDLLAATAVASKASGTAGIGGTRIRSLLGALGKPQKLKGGSRLARLHLKGNSLDEILSILEERGLTNRAKFTKRFGDRAEAFQGLQSLIGNRDLFRKVRGEIGAAEKGDLTGKVIASREGLGPQEQAARAVRKAENRETLAGGNLGAQRNMADAMLSRQRALLLQGKSTGDPVIDAVSGAIGGEATAGLFKGIIGVARRFAPGSVDEELIRGGAKQGTVSPEELKILTRSEEHLRRISETLGGSLNGDPRKDN